MKNTIKSVSLLCFLALFIACDEVETINNSWSFVGENSFQASYSSPTRSGGITTFSQSNLKQLNTGGFISDLYEVNYNFINGFSVDSIFWGTLYIDAILTDSSLVLNESSESFFDGVDNASSRNQNSSFLNLNDISVNGLRYEFVLTAYDPIENHTYTISSDEDYPVFLITSQKKWNVIPSNGTFSTAVSPEVSKSYYSHVDSSYQVISIGSFSSAQDSISISFPEKITAGTYELFSVIPGSDLAEANLTLLGNNYNTATVGAQVIVEGVNEIDGLVQGRIVGTFSGGANSIDVDINFKATLEAK